MQRRPTVRKISLVVLTILMVLMLVCAGAGLAIVLTNKHIENRGRGLGHNNGASLGTGRCRQATPGNTSFWYRSGGRGERLLRELFSVQSNTSRRLSDHIFTLQVRLSLHVCAFHLDPFMNYL